MGPGKRKKKEGKEKKRKKKERWERNENEWPIKFNISKEGY